VRPAEGRRLLELRLRQRETVNRALSQLATKTGKPVTSIDKLIVWGNHSPTMYPDIRFATIDRSGSLIGSAL
jgi:hypothetical protein